MRKRNSWGPCAAAPRDRGTEPMWWMTVNTQSGRGMRATGNPRAGGVDRTGPHRRHVKTPGADETSGDTKE